MTIQEKCQQYANARGVLDEEFHAVLNWIHRKAVELEAAREAGAREARDLAVAEAVREACAKSAESRAWETIGQGAICPAVSVDIRAIDLQRIVEGVK
jgi:hypothetical protein